MHLRNRVTPFGDIVAIPQRGTFTGNRGIIHDPMMKTLLTKRWASKAWLICSCEYKGRRREVMGRRSWTELFFLDEAVALAERMEHGRKLIHAIPGPLSELPDGAVIAMSGSAFTVSGGQAFRWTEYGYEPPQRIPRADGLLTPPSTLMTLRAGYRPVLHPTLETSRPGQRHHERPV
jgi:hypothetical protein